jgi:hypothetical protein
MKNIKVTDIGQIKNELRKYKAGKKFDINQFNQIARLAWLGKVVMQPLDPEDPSCKSFLLYADFPSDFIEHFLNTDQDLIGQMHIVDSEQAQALIKILEQGVQERANQYQQLKQKDFYFQHFYEADDQS